jgi:hypothetical protein
MFDEKSSDPIFEENSQLWQQLIFSSLCLNDLLDLPAQLVKSFSRKSNIEISFKDQFCIIGIQNV